MFLCMWSKMNDETTPKVDLLGMSLSINLHVNGWNHLSGWLNMGGIMYTNILVWLSKWQIAPKKNLTQFSFLYSGLFHVTKLLPQRKQVGILGSRLITFGLLENALLNFLKARQLE